MAEEIEQYVKDAYMFLGGTNKETQRVMLYLLKNPNGWIISDELLKQASNPKPYLLPLEKLEDLGLAEHKYRKPREGGGWSNINVWKLKQDLDKNFTSLLKEELEIKLQKMEI